MSLWSAISEHITQVTGDAFVVSRQQQVGGGCINQTTLISDGKRDYFVKMNAISHGDMFAAEAEGLAEIAGSNTIRVPQPICYGDDGRQCYIVLEYLDMHGSPDMEIFGRQIAHMHGITKDRFGWQRNNTIGSTPQINDWQQDYLHFWREQRLGYQLKLAQRNGCGHQLLKLGDKLLAKLPALFDNYKPVPSMLHGDLWGGNAAGLGDGTPVIYDPAFYYGDREAELAMTQLFGGFGQSFYAAYNEAWPLDEGFKVRKTFYNLYHIINHFNMFGGGYLAQSIHMAEQVLAQI
ncbi:MAG: fructosamine kinase family protein [Gammaproteobacteria bacterium]|nr:MAG: fructosamine kinase family protein [Gammaproteobacteria bacterium]